MVKKKLYLAVPDDRRRLEALALAILEAFESYSFAAKQCAGLRAQAILKARVSIESYSAADAIAEADHRAMPITLPPQRELAIGRYRDD